MDYHESMPGVALPAILNRLKEPEFKLKAAAYDFRTQGIVNRAFMAGYEADDINPLLEFMHSTGFSFIDAHVIGHEWWDYAKELLKGRFTHGHITRHVAACKAHYSALAGWSGL
jgi:hypothetical protein